MQEPSEALTAAYARAVEVMGKALPRNKEVYAEELVQSVVALVLQTFKEYLEKEFKDEFNKH